jgi:protein PsiE
MFVVIQNGKIALTDLLLMFILCRSSGHGGSFLSIPKDSNRLANFHCKSRALCRLMILQGKGVSTIDLIYEGCAVLLLAASHPHYSIRFGVVKKDGKEERMDCFLWGL